MNRIIRAGFIATVALSFTACNAFLEVEPSSGFTPKEVFSSESEMLSAVAGVYSQLISQDAYGRGFTYMFNPNTDVEIAAVASNEASSEGSDIACYEPRPTWSQLNNTWTAAYRIINLANDVISNIEDSELYQRADKKEASAVTQMYGEVKVLRAMVYLDLIRVWGDVVFRTHISSGDENFKKGVSSRQEILQYLIEDLKSVEPLMQYASVLDFGVERASRTFCQSLIGLLAMTKGGWTLSPDKTNPSSKGYMTREDSYEEDYKIAIEYLGKAIQEKQHDLGLSFKDFWIKQNNLETPTNDDIIFSLPFLQGSSGDYAYNVGVRIDNYDESEESKRHEYGSASGRINLCVTYLYSFDKEDLRRDVTCTLYKYTKDLQQWISWKKEGVDNAFEMSNSSIASVSVAKWSKLEMTNAPGKLSQGGTGVNFPYMRLAEVLLLYAEAVNELEGPTAEAKECLKRVRRRAFDASNWATKVDAYVDSKSSKEDFFQAIMDEKKWEFGGESKRKFDLARWNKFGEVVYDQYHIFKHWASKAGNGYDNIPSYIYTKDIPDPEHAGRTKLQMLGVDEIFNSAVAPEGYTIYDRLDLAVSWYGLDNTTEQFEYSNEIKWSYRGFINIQNESSVQPTNVVRYLCPYPTKVITDHGGAIQNFYGFNY